MSKSIYKVKATGEFVIPWGVTITKINQENSPKTAQKYVFLNQDFMPTGITQEFLLEELEIFR